jgi:hypothetical protein
MGWQPRQIFTVRPDHIKRAVAGQMPALHHDRKYRRTLPFLDWLS